MKNWIRRILLAPFWVMMGDVSWIGAIASAKESRAASDKATNANTLAATNANALQQRELDLQREAQAPWVAAGTSAVNQLSSGMSQGGQFSTVPTFQFNPAQVQQDPGYAFRTQQGVNALTAAGSAAGNLGSGNLGTALVNYGQQAGSQEYGAAYNRIYQQQLDEYNSQLNNQNTIFNRLSGIAGTGQTASNQLGSYGLATATNMGNNLLSSAVNSGIMGTNAATQIGNNIQSGFSNASNSVNNQLMSGLKTYNYNNALQQQQANNYGFGDAYSNSNGYGGVTGGSYAGTDMYAGDLY